MFRLFAMLIAGLVVAGCTNPNDLDGPTADLGDFHLGHNVVVAPNLTQGPASRKASKEEWIESMKAAIDERFSRYDGDSLYHLGISVEGYVLAIPGVPVVASPKSVLIIKVTAWDDAAGKKLNEEPEQITVVETLSGETVLGSGLTQSKEQQMRNLSRNASKRIETWLVQQHARHGWFDADEAATEEPAPAAAETAAEEDAESADSGKERVVEATEG
ncbi:hypothetical protein [Roseovarius salinarum]|uniref:hypothetical protein n=1 Tax=Roseovarius salinarum TaxID=1981892 RepID=UPI0018E4C367|nr:hypothetical protein [Roseovarius salinarum]